MDVTSVLRNHERIYKLNKCEVLKGYYQTNEGEKLVAVKVLTCDDIDEVNKRMNEVVSTLRLGHIPRVVRVYDVG